MNLSTSLLIFSSLFLIRIKFLSRDSNLKFGSESDSYRQFLKQFFQLHQVKKGYGTTLVHDDLSWLSFLMIRYFLSFLTSFLKLFESSKCLCLGIIKIQVKNLFSQIRSLLFGFAFPSQVIVNGVLGFIIILVIRLLRSPT